MERGQLIAKRFEIQKLAGRGGMGEVYVALDHQTQSPVAIKILRDPGDRQSMRFLREAQTLSTLSHPGIVGYVAHGELRADEPFLVMEWLEGIGLSDLLLKRPLSLQESLSFFSKVLSILTYAHERNVIHRDLKPSNIFLRGGSLEDPVLLDFGIARLMGVHAPMTNTGALVGSPGYIAPEQARGDRMVDARVDLFSLGCVFFECLTGKPPFWGEHVIAVLSKILLEDAPRLRDMLPDAPDTLDDWLATLLAKDPSSRPRSAREANEQLSLISVQVPQRTRKALTEQERRLLCVVLWESFDAKTIQQDVVTLLGETLAPEPERESLFQLVLSLGGRLEPLANGSMVVVFWGSAATELAVQCARCAMALREVLPLTSFAMAMGRAEQSRPIGETIDRAASLLTRNNQTPGIFIDEALLGLLEARFDIHPTKTGLSLSEEKSEPNPERTLLGKPTPYVGRETELRLLENSFEASCEDSEAKAVLVTAHVGAGKSRLRQEFMRYVSQQHPDAEIFVGYGEPLKAASPFGLLAPALRRAAGITDNDTIEVKRRKLRARLAKVISPKELLRVSQFFGEMIGVNFPEEESPALCAAQQNRRLMRDQMLRAFLDWLSAECSQHPVLLVLEDLQWGDLPTVQFIDEALTRLRELPFFVLALARPEVQQVFPRLWEGKDKQEVCLGRLSKRACTQLAKAVLGDMFSAASIERIVERSGGNAFYLEELIRSAAEGRDEVLPETVLAVAQARLEELPQEARRVLRAASIFGDLFFEGGIRALLGEETHGVTVSLDLLCRREVIQSRSDSQYHFRHSLFREASYAALTEEDKRLGHRLAGEWLISNGELDAQVLASHFERGDDHTRVISWYCRAAEQALGAGALDAVLSYADRGRLAGASQEFLGELCLLAAEAHIWRGENARTEALCAEAMRYLQAGSLLWYRAAQCAFRALGRLGYRDQLISLVEALSRSPSKTQTRAEEVLAWSSAFFALHVLGAFDLAADTFTRFESLVSLCAPDDPVLSFDIPFTRALWASLSGDVGEALGEYRATILACHRLGDQRRECVATVSAAFVYIELGGYEHTKQAMLGVLPLSEKMELRSVNAHAKNLLALALTAQGVFDEAIELATQAVESFVKQQDRRNEGGARYDLARILLRAKQYDTALLEARLAVHALEIAPPIRATAFAVLAEIYLSQGEAQKALDAATQGNAILSSLGSTEDNEALIRLMYAESLLACGEIEAAKVASTTAKERLLARAEKIQDPGWRRAFLEDVPEHARTLKAGNGE